jgi:small-conductance mechanosensitive channel
VVIFPYLPGSDSKIFQGVTVFLGVLFSFGSSSAISNMVAGLVITYMRPFKIGDRVKVGEITGDVVEKNLLITRIRTIKNEDITVPNSTILGGAVINYTTSSKNLGLILHTSITIGYDARWSIIHGLMIDAALATEGIMAEPKPFILQTDLNDFNVTYQVNAYTSQSHKMAVIYSNLHQNIQDKFNEAGVEIMSPHYTALRDGNTIQIPDNYKPKEYVKPGFKVENEK